MEHNTSIEEICATQTFAKNLQVILFARRRASLAKYKQRKAAGMKPIEDPVDQLANWKAETVVWAYRNDLTRKMKLPLGIRKVVRELGEAAVNKTLEDFAKRAIPETPNKN